MRYGPSRRGLQAAVNRRLEATAPAPDMAQLDYPKLTAWLVTLIMAAAFAYIVYTSRQAAKGSYVALKPQAGSYVQKVDQALREAEKDISGR